jgi:transcriptional regulator with XRE-family HTH domain
MDTPPATAPAATPASIPSALGKILRRRRGNLSQAAFAEKVGKRQSTISAWESGANRLSVESYVEVARAFGLSSEVIEADVAEAARDILDQPAEGA